MAVAFRSSSQTGTSDAFITSINVPVPASAAANDIAIVAIEQWESANPAVTPPAGFTALTPVVSGSQKLKIFWKRLTGADTGNYTFSWTGSQWSMGHCILLTGGITSGDPVEATNTATATDTNVPSTSVTTATEPFLGHFIANENASTGTPPTNYTETRDGDYLKSNYRVPAATGSHTASGGTLSTSTLMLVELVAIKPEAGGGSTQTVVVQTITASSSVLNPQVTSSVLVSAINTSSTILSPQIIGIISVPTINISSTIPSPKVDQIVNTSIINTVSSVLAPTVVNMLQPVNPGLLQTESFVLSPTIAGGEAPVMLGTISDVARVNMLADRVLTEPQLLSNVDLMRLVLADGTQTLVTKTEATPAVHLWRYLKQVRDAG